MSNEALGTNLANLVFEVVLRIYGYVVVQNINWIFRLLVCLHAEYKCINILHYTTPQNNVAANSAEEFYLCPFCCFNYNIWNTITNSRCSSRIPLVKKTKIFQQCLTWIDDHQEQLKNIKDMETI